MSKLLLAAFGVAIASLCPSAGRSSDDADAQYSTAAFLCSVLAAESSDASGNRKVASALASSALLRAKPVATKMLTLFHDPANATKNGPLGDFMAEVTPEFYVGLMFAQASKDAEALLPQAGDSPGTFEDYQLRKSAMADIEFTKRNCGLLLR